MTNQTLKKTVRSFSAILLTLWLTTDVLAIITNGNINDLVSPTPPTNKQRIIFEGGGGGGGDSTPPQISNIIVTNITATTAFVHWTTNEPATSQVEYGLGLTYGFTTPLDSSLVTSHTVLLSGLSGLSTYYFRVRSLDSWGNQQISPNQTFETANPGPSIVTVSGTQLIVQKRNLNGTLQPAAPYAIRGVNWSPASQNTATSPSDPNNANVRRSEFGLWYQTDIPLMADMNVNTVRTYMDFGFPEWMGALGDDELAEAGWDILTELYKNGIMVIMTVDDASNNFARLLDVVIYYRSHPAILFWSLGNEWNINCHYQIPPDQCQGDAVAEAAFNTQVSAGAIQTLDNYNHPIGTSYGEIDINQPGKHLSDTINYVNSICSIIDIWGLNIYRGQNFGDLFLRWDLITWKPMYIAEFGIDAYHTGLGAVDETAQAEWDISLWNHVHGNLSAADPAKVGLGSTVFEWNDEWWKVSPYGSQQTGGWSSGAFPDGVGNEEYFGIVDINRGPREVYGALTIAFHPDYVPPPQETTLAAFSAGYGNPGYLQGMAVFSHNGVTIYAYTGGAGGGRGFNIATVNAQTGEIINSGQNFDTWATASTGEAMNAMINYLDSIPDGTLVMIAVGDEAGLNPGFSCTNLGYPWVPQGIDVLESLGSTQIQNSAYALHSTSINMLGIREAKLASTPRYMGAS